MTWAKNYGERYHIGKTSGRRVRVIVCCDCGAEIPTKAAKKRCSPCSDIKLQRMMVAGQKRRRQKLREATA